LSQFTSRIRTANGTNLSISWTNVIMYDSDDSAKGIMSIGMDNTEQEKAFEEVKQLKQELDKENIMLNPVAAETEVAAADIIGKSEAFLYAVQKSRLVANTNASVLLLGETGSGKEMFAGLIHENSYRNEKAFVKVNCAALPADLMESELFGHEKGAFTGAVSARKGKFELANGGTIFLDEIGELPVSLQSKLLRVLQNGEFERIGGQQVIKVDVRVISATNRNLQNEVRAGAFREDLFYRLNVFPITIPPLRKRKSDIPLLISHYLQLFATEQHKEVFQVSKADMVRLTEYSWPGNIRELKNMIERSVVISRGPALILDWQGEVPAISISKTDELTERESIESVEKAHILKVLEHCNWKINGADGAALRLGLHPSTLRSKLKKLGIERARAS
ncbi:sigma-54 interaction domain-containing protein, partial [Flavihumibacter petaseus]